MMIPNDYVYLASILFKALHTFDHPVPSQACRHVGDMQGVGLGSRLGACAGVYSLGLRWFPGA